MGSTQLGQRITVSTQRAIVPLDGGLRAPYPGLVAPDDRLLSRCDERAVLHRRPPGPPGPPERLRLIIADPDPLARRVIRESMQASKGLVVAAEARDGTEAVELAFHYRPDLVLMEVQLPRFDGIEACRRIVERAPEVRVVMFSVDQEPGVQIKALRAGASGFLSKSSRQSSVANALRSVARGEAAISRKLTTSLIDLMRTTSERGIGIRPVKSVLTSREWEVFDLMCLGATTRDIADDLVVSQDTVYSHTKSILRKLGVHSRADAIEEAERLRRAA